MRAPVLLFLLCISLWADNPQGTFNVPQFATCTAASCVINIDSFDANDAVAGPYTVETVKICLDDPTFTNNCTTLNNTTSTSSVNWTRPTTIGSVTPNDGNQHIIYCEVIGATVTNPCTNNAFPYRWMVAANVLGPVWTAPTQSVYARGLTPATMAVLANTSDPYSVGSAGATVCTVSGQALKDDGVAAYYVQKWGIPCANVAVVTTPVTQTITQANFNSQILPAVSGLSASLQGVAIAWVQPMKVSPISGRPNSICSMVATGGSTIVQPIMSGRTGSQAPSNFTTSNPLFNLPITATPFTTYAIRPTMQLVGETCSGCTTSNTEVAPAVWSESFAAAKTMIDASFASQGTNPTGGNVDLAWTADSTRSRGAKVWSTVNNGTVLTPRIASAGVVGSSGTPVSGSTISATNILVYENGNANEFIWSGSVITGSAMMFSLTSSAGLLPMDNQQTPVAWWLQSGAVGTYGTMDEPSTQLPKFPDVALFTTYYAARGGTMAEALWASVYWPYVGTFAGDPLAAPFTLLSNTGGTGGSVTSGLTMRGIIQ